MKSFPKLVYKDKNNFYEEGCEKLVSCSARVVKALVYLATQDTSFGCGVSAKQGDEVPSYYPNTIPAMKIFDPVYGYLYIEVSDFSTECAGVSFSGFVETVEPGDGIIVDSTDPAHPIVSSSFSPSIIKTLQDRSLKTYYKLEKNFETEGIGNITKNGAIAAVTPVAVGPYDQYDITGGNETSYITFNNIILTDSGAKIYTRIKVDSINANPYIGIRVQNNPAYYSLVTGSAIAYLKQASSLINALIATANYGDGVDYNTGGTPFLINAGDIIEVTLKRDIVYKQRWEFYVLNTATGQFISRTREGLQPSNVANSPADVGLILADGKFTILDYDIQSQDGEGSKCCILSCLTGIGFNLQENETIVHFLNAKMIYRNIALGGEGANINGFVRGSVPELLTLRPQSVAIIDSLSISQGWFKVGNPQNANFLAKLPQLTDAIRSYGGVPLFFKYKALPVVTAPDMLLWNTWVDTNAATYGAEIVDLTGGPALVDDGFTPIAPYTEYMADAIIAKLTALNLLP